MDNGGAHDWQASFVSNEQPEALGTTSGRGGEGVPGRPRSPAEGVSIQARSEWKSERCKRRPASITPDLKASLERALGKKVTLTQGDTERTVTKAEAGMEQLVNQFAKGDRYARRDLMALAGALGVDLAQGQAIEKALEAAVTANDATLVADFLHRQGIGRNDRDDASDASLPSSNDQEKPGGSEPGETTI
jgi:hypothetical protein